ncbi:MAG: hypothetical protein LBK62_11380 [Treponema sp.]|nr:hypothetical protein [Treponema sp.]
MALGLLRAAPDPRPGNPGIVLHLQGSPAVHLHQGSVIAAFPLQAQVPQNKLLVCDYTDKVAVAAEGKGIRRRTRQPPEGNGEA